MFSCYFFVTTSSVVCFLSFFFFPKVQSKIGVRIIHGRALYTGKYGNDSSLWKSVSFVSLESRCFPQPELDRHSDSPKTKLTVLTRTSHQVLNVSELFLKMSFINFIKSQITSVECTYRICIDIQLLPWTFSNDQQILHAKIKRQFFFLEKGI